ncbi:hypothetical protein Taro_033775 [Colocasia esculenta]|uniref:FHA domain-containing protein n=1 Tax=Colocasia esculenta TaxID=4460 RepID=A0A843VPK8_COLES|nr:hypothetical protein [Colocasia esculenta]
MKSIKGKGVHRQRGHKLKTPYAEGSRVHDASVQGNKRSVLKFLVRIYASNASAKDIRGVDGDGEAATSDGVPKGAVPLTSGEDAYRIGMSLAMHRGSPGRRRYPNHSRSPVRNRDHRDSSPPPKKSSPRRGRSPDHHRSPPGMKSLVRNGSSQRTRSPTKGKLREHSRSPRHERSRSPAKEKMSSRVRSPRRGRSRSPLKEKLPQHTRSPKHIRPRSPVNEKVSNIRRSPGHRQSRSPKNQKPPQHGRSPKEVHSSSPVRNSSSRSPSPRTKHLKQAQVEREMEKMLHSEEGRSIGRERDKGRNRERGENRDASDERRLGHEKSDGRTSRSSRHAHDRSSSPMERGHRSGYGIRSPSRASKAAARDEVTRMRGVQQHQDDHEDSVSRMKAMEEALEEKQKQKPSFELSGKLAEETNRVRGITLLFTEPPDARKPDVRWRLYVFKAGEVLNEPLYVHRQSCYLFGRERRVADIPTDHPSCSKQHAVLQYRLVEKEKPDGLLSKQVRPYLMDLGSTNGTFLNDDRIEPQRYYELREQDVIKFGNSSRCTLTI